VSVEPLPPAGLIELHVWGDLGRAMTRVADVLGAPLPAPGHAADVGAGWRAIRIGPARWRLAGPLEEIDARLERFDQALAPDGAAIDLSGGFARLRIVGDGWRSLLMIGGVFDAEDLAFGPGCTAATVLRHVAVRYDVVGEDTVDVWLAPSTLEDCLHGLRAAAAHLAPPRS
jgi:heterotetrameric sarcosine oxidase gamma subunit